MNEKADKIKQQLMDLKKNTDLEVRHMIANSLLCDLLNNLGYTEIVKLYEDLDKWYA